jgi:hypothetical protein
MSPLFRALPINAETPAYAGLPMIGEIWVAAHGFGRFSAALAVWRAAWLGVH